MESKFLIPEFDFPWPSLQIRRKFRRAATYLKHTVPSLSLSLTHMVIDTESFGGTACFLVFCICVHAYNVFVEMFNSLWWTHGRPLKEEYTSTLLFLMVLRGPLSCSWKFFQWMATRMIWTPLLALLKLVTLLLQALGTLYSTPISLSWYINPYLTYCWNR